MSRVGEEEAWNKSACISHKPQSGSAFPTGRSSQLLSEAHIFSNYSYNTTRTDNWYLLMMVSKSGGGLISQTMHFQYFFYLENNFLFMFCIICGCSCLHVYLCAIYMQSLWRPEEDVDNLELELQMAGCLHMSASNGTQILCKSNKCSYTVSHL